MKQKWSYLVVTASACLIVVVWFWGSKSGAAPKARPGPTRVAVVNVYKVFNEYQRSKDMNRELTRLRDELQGQRKQMSDRVEALIAEIKNFKPDSKDYRERRRELMELQIKRKTHGQVGQEEIRQQMRIMTEEVYKEIISVVEAIAKETGYDLVLSRGVDQTKREEVPILLRKVLYASESIDLTEPVLQRLDQNYKLRQAGGGQK